MWADAIGEERQTGQAPVPMPEDPELYVLSVIVSDLKEMIRLADEFGSRGLQRSCGRP